VEWEVLFYEDAAGRSPVRDYLRKLTPEQRKKIGWTIRLLEQNGITLAMPYSRPLVNTDGLRELRTTLSGNIFRCIYFPWTARRLVILHAFPKKTEQTRQSDIDLALQRRVDWMARNKEAG
jgi:phage-related protein